MKLNRSDINTEKYWSDNYRKGERGGWWENNKLQGAIKHYLKVELDSLVMFKGKQKIKLIEVGGGTGLSGMRILKDYPMLEIHNVDISSYAIDFGKKKYPQLTHVCWNANIKPQFPELTEQFDVLISQETLEHLQNPIRSLEYMLSFLKKEGIAFFAMPYKELYSGGKEHIQSFDYNDIPSLFFKFTNEVTICNFLPMGNNLHLAVKFRKIK